MNRGSDRRRLARGRRGLASMRPRFMNRGSRPASSVQRGRESASMRPRFMNRGSWACNGPLRGYGNRFNEAPIHESGK